MPYKIVQHGNKFSVVAQDTGHVAGTHPSKSKAQAQMAALYANEPEARKCMTCGCEDLGNDHNHIPEIEKQMITGGEGWSIEFGTPDCQHGWAILKGGTAQSIGCYITKEAAEEALSGLKNEQINIVGDEVRTTKTPEEFKEDHIPLMNKSLKAESFWSGVFVPADKGQMATEFNAQDQDARYYFPSKATYENDGKPSAGYGNRSSNDSIPEGNKIPDRTTQPYKGK